MYYETEKIELKEKVTDVLVKEIESFSFNSIFSVS